MPAVISIRMSNTCSRILQPLMLGRLMSILATLQLLNQSLSMSVPLTFLIQLPQRHYLLNHCTTTPMTMSPILVELGSLMLTDKEILRPLMPMTPKLTSMPTDDEDEQMKPEVTANQMIDALKNSGIKENIAAKFMHAIMKGKPKKPSRESKSRTSYSTAAPARKTSQQRRPQGYLCQDSWRRFCLP